MIRQTHTCANLPVSLAAFNEIKGKLQAADYKHLILDDESTIVLQGIALIVEPAHKSDCAVHNEPASANGPCDCAEPPAPIMLSDFRKAVESTINRFSKENGSNTPDFILAQFLVDSLSAYDKAVTAREKWYGREPNPVPPDQAPPPPDSVGKPFFTGI